MRRHSAARLKKFKELNGRIGSVGVGSERLSLWLCMGADLANCLAHCTRDDRGSARIQSVGPSFKI